jgi:hypothetical protein
MACLLNIDACFQQFLDFDISIGVKGDLVLFQNVGGGLCWLTSFMNFINKHREYSDVLDENLKNIFDEAQKTLDISDFTRVCFKLILKKEISNTTIREPVPFKGFFTFLEYFFKIEIISQTNFFVNAKKKVQTVAHFST